MQHYHFLLFVGLELVSRNLKLDIVLIFIYFFVSEPFLPFFHVFPGYAECPFFGYVCVCVLGG